jgi:hypothetical protein
VSALDEEVATDTEALWFAEAERRLEELRSEGLTALMLMRPFGNAREVLKLA